MDSENPHVFLDDTSPEIVYTGACEASTSNATNTWGGSQRVCEPTSAVDIKFYGKGLEVFGELDSELRLESLMDGSTYTPLPHEFEGIPSGTKGTKLFDLGALSNPHTVHLAPLSGRLILDYAIYTPVGKTKLDGKTLVYDDTNPSFVYSSSSSSGEGGWEGRVITGREGGEGGLGGALPLNGTLGEARGGGRWVSIGFVGSSVAVYGALNASSSLPLSAIFSIDGSAPEPVRLNSSSPSATDTGGGGEGESQWTLHQKFFEHTFADANDKTQHVLNVTVVEASEGQPFLLDYILTTGNAHTALKDRPFKKTGSEAKTTGMRIGLIVLGIAVLLAVWVGWRRWREGRRRRRGVAELSKA